VESINLHAGRRVAYMIYDTVAREEASNKSDIISRVADSPLNILTQLLVTLRSSLRLVALPLRSSFTKSASGARK